MHKSLPYNLQRCAKKPLQNRTTLQLQETFFSADIIWIDHVIFHNSSTQSNIYLDVPDKPTPKVSKSALKLLPQGSKTPLNRGHTPQKGLDLGQFGPVKVSKLNRFQ